VPLKFFRKYVPNAEQVRSRRLVAMFGAWLHHPNLWHLNRRSVPGALAIGLFCGLIPGPIQMLGALILVVLLKKNLPVALVATFYTNPLTIVPIYLLAYQYGSLFVPGEQRIAGLPRWEMDWSDWGASLDALLDWVVALGTPLAIGLVALGLTLALAGYLAARFGWEAYVRAAWKKRRARRRAR
jgi:hypothetical protein